MEFRAFQKVPRLNRGMVVTEKIDGTNASVHIVTAEEDSAAFEASNVLTSQWSMPVAVRQGFVIRAGSRTRWITPDDDNFGFAAWVLQNADELVQLGVGRHFGEWWGRGIQRGYGLDHRRFSLFNTGRWTAMQPSPLAVATDATPAPACCDVVPVLYRGPFSTWQVNQCLTRLSTYGSLARPGFQNPEGVMVYHEAAGAMFKATLKDDDKPKGGKA